MAKKIVSLLACLLLLCSQASPSLALGGGAGKDDARMQAIQTLKDKAAGSVRFDEKDGQVFLSGKLSGKQTPGASAALRFLQDNAALFGIGNAKSELLELRTVRDGGDTFVKFTQALDGAKVEGGALTVHFDRGGVITGVSGRVVRVPGVASSGGQRISEGEAVDVAERQFAFDSLRNEPTAERMIIPVGSKYYEAYRVNIAFTSPEITNYDVYVEAYTGKVLRTDNKIEYSGNVSGSGVDVTGATRSLHLYLNGAYYQMRDFARPATSGIRTWDLGHSVFPEDAVIVQNTTNYFNSTNFRASVSAHYFAGVVVDFYKQLFNRNSLDGAGMPITSYTHFATNFNNAGWDGYEMIYGDGDGEVFTYLSGDLDVVGHEMTHGVITNTCNLDYNDQSGALNESIADTFGVLIETYDKYNVDNGGSWTFNTSDWRVGDQVFTPHISGDALRSLSDPHNGSSVGHSKWQPDKMSEYQKLPDTDEGDNGGVHINSGIPNKAAYLIAKSIGMEKTAEIYYRVVTDYLDEYSDFMAARYCLEMSAMDLYGDDSDEAAAVRNAFFAVEIGPDPNVNDPYEPNDMRRMAYEIYPGTAYQSYINSDADIDWYKITVHASGNLHIDLTDIPQDLAEDPTDCDYDLYLYDSSGSDFDIDSSSHNDLAPEAIDFSAPGPGVYYVSVVPYKSAYASGKPAFSTKQMYSLSFTAPGEAVSGISLDKHEASLKPGSKLALKATVSPDDAANQQVAWSSTDPNIATVDKAGNVTAKAIGSATITATTADGGFADSCALTVAIPVTGVSLNKHDAGQLPAGTETLTAKIAPADATNKAVTWSSSDESVATVDDSGVVTAAGLGTAKISITTKDGGFTDACTFTVVASIAEPSNLKAAPSYNSVTLSWGAVCAAESYDVYRAASMGGVFSKIGSTSSTSFTNGSLATGSTYYYKVIAIRGSSPAAIGPFSATVSARVAPQAPLSFAAASYSYNSIRVTWRAVAGATKYELYRATSRTGAYTMIASTTALSYTNTGVTTGGTYFYKARTYRTVGTTKIYGPWTAVVSAKATLATPASVRASRASSSSIKVSWGAVSGKSGYEVWRSTAYSGTYSLVKSTTSNYWTNTGLAAGRTYYYKVRAYRLVSGRKVYSAYSAVVYAKT